MTRVALLGDGPEAAQIGAEYALGGCSVLSLTADPEASRLSLEDALRAASQHGLAGPADLERARALISHHGVGDSTEDRLTLIVEALPEQLELKAAAISQLAEGHPEALVVSVSETLSVTAIGEAAGVGERMLGARYGSPPLLTPLVELVAARDTPRRLLDRLSQLLRAIGKRPVVLEREIAGLLSRRLELALLRECIWLADRGVASAETIDEVVRDGLARGWRLAGPFETVALRGLDARETGEEEWAQLAGEPPPRGKLAGLLPHDPELVSGLRERRDVALAAELRAERASASRLRGQAR
ncbi:MAG: 3-hydroxyacyl-CoA dehydrogenase family protein [Solirubrobacteraceae bacterium]